MGKLVIFDASVYLHAGTKSKRGQLRCHYGFHMGGIEKLVEAIVYAIREKDTKVMVTFDSETDRKDYIKSYKAHRVSDARVHMQDLIILPSLRAIGVQCFKEAGCESDDLIFEAVKVNYDNFDRIVIKTNDMDMAALIDEKGKVSIETPTSISYDVTRKTYESVLSGTSTAKEVVKRWKKFEETIEPTCDVTANNFMQVVDSHNTVIFNSITAFKVFFGDSSDGIPAFSRRDDLLQVYSRFCLWGYDQGNDFGELSDVSVMIEYYQSNPENFTEEELETLANRIHVFYPRKTNLDMLYNNSLEINIPRLVDMAVAYGLRDVQKIYNNTDRTSPNQIARLKDWSMKVKSGSVSVDYDLLINSEEAIVDSETENLDIYMGENVGGF